MDPAIARVDCGVLFATSRNGWRGTARPTG